MFPTILFYAAAAMLIGAAIAVITVRNPVHAVLSPDPGLRQQRRALAAA